MNKNVASQSLAVFAFTTTTGVAKTGDAANIAVYVSKDWGSVTQLADTSATEMDATNAPGWYLFAVSQAETNADALLFTGKSSTANIAIVGQLIYTLPASFSSSVAQTGDSYARLGAPAGASVSADIAAVKTDTAAVKVQTDKMTFTVANQMDSNVIDWKGATAPAMTGDAFARLGAPAGASVSADVAAVKTDTAAVKVQTDKLAFTVANKVDANVYTWNGTAVSAPATAGIPEVNVKNMNNVAATAITTIKAVQGLTTADTIATYTGNTPQTGDAYARIGANGVSLSAIPDEAGVTTLLARLSAARASNLDSLQSFSGTASAGGATTITLAGAVATDNYYNNQLVAITGGTGAGQARFISAYVGATKVATVATWATNPDNTSTFIVIPFDAVAGATAPTVAQIATGVWQDTTAGDFTVAASVGKSVMNGVALGTGLTVARCTLTDTLTTYTGNTVQTGDSFARIGVAGAGLTNIDLPNQTMDITGNLSGSVGSVTGAVGSVTGAVASVTGNVGGNVVGTVASVVGAVGSVTGNVGGTVASVVGAVGSVTGLTASDVGAIKAKTDNLPASPAATGDIAAALTATVADSVPADGTRPSIAQAVLMITRFLNERSVTGTTVTVAKEDGTTASMTFTLNDATTPTSITRAT